MSAIEEGPWVPWPKIKVALDKTLELLKNSEYEHVVVTSRGKPIAALMSFDRLDRLVASEEILKKHTEIELEELGGKTLKIGLVGYLEDNFDKDYAKELVGKAFDDMVNDFGQYGDLTYTIVSSLVASGIPLLGYEEATRRGWGTIGVAPDAASGEPWYSVDEHRLVGDVWGDECDEFIDGLDVLICIGKTNLTEMFSMVVQEHSIEVYDYSLDETTTNMLDGDSEGCGRGTG